MIDQPLWVARMLGRPSAPAVVVTLFVLAMSACVPGLVVWKAADARTTALAQRSREIQKIARSLAEQASHAIQSVDIALTDMVELLQYQTPNADRADRHLREIVTSLPQIREIVMVDAAGVCRYSSRTLLSCGDGFSEQDYFAHHRDHADKDLHLSGSLLSAGTGRPTVNLSKRRFGKDGQFAGVIVATVNNENFSELYATFQLGAGGGVSVLRDDGMVLIRSPAMRQPAERWPGRFSGFHKIAPGDGTATYVAYARAPRYPFIIAVAQQEDDILQNWRSGLRSDIIVAALLLCSVILLAALLSSQFRLRLEIEKRLQLRKDELDALNSRLAELATTDGLTGLANRRSLDGFLRLEFAAQRDIAVLLFDIDNFKGFNDSLGHQAGDDCLKRVAAVLAAATADRVGLSARYGGEEFAVILPGVTEHDAFRIAEALRREVAALGIANAASDRGYLTVSVGVAGNSAVIANEQALLRNADLALYAAKRRGRDRSVACSSLTEPDVGIVPNQLPTDIAQGSAIATPTFAHDRG